MLSMQLERDMLTALKSLGDEAGVAYLHHHQKARVPNIGRLVARIMKAVDFKRWVRDRLMPVLRNHAARTAGDTQRILRQEVGPETVIEHDDVVRLEDEAGRFLRVSDIEPQVRSAIEAAILDGVAKRENPEAIARRIKDMVPQGRFTKAGNQYRARLIARQETLHMQREATLKAYKANPRIDMVRVRDGIFGPPRSDAACIDRSGELIPVADAEALAPELHPQCTVSYDPVVEPTATLATS